MRQRWVDYTMLILILFMAAVFILAQIGILDLTVR